MASPLVNYVAPSAGAYSEPGTMSVEVSFTNPSSLNVSVIKYVVFLADESRLSTEQFVSGNMEELVVTGTTFATGRISYVGIDSGLEVVVIVQVTFADGTTTAYSTPSNYLVNGATTETMYTPPAAPSIPDAGALRLPGGENVIIVNDPDNLNIGYYYVITQWFDSSGDFQVETQQLSSEPTILPSPYRVIRGVQLQTDKDVAVAIQACIPYPLSSSTGLFETQYQATSTISNTQTFIDGTRPQPPENLQMIQENIGTLPTIEPLSFDLTWDAPSFASLIVGLPDIFYVIEKSLDGVTYVQDGVSTTTSYTTQGNDGLVGQQVYYLVKSVNIETEVPSVNNPVVQSLVFGRTQPALNLDVTVLEQDRLDEKRLVISFDAPNELSSDFITFYGYGFPGTHPSSRNAWLVEVLKDGVVVDTKYLDFISGTDSPISHYTTTSSLLSVSDDYLVRVSGLTTIGNYAGQTETTDLPEQYPFLGLPATRSTDLSGVPLWLSVEIVPEPSALRFVTATSGSRCIDAVLNSNNSTGILGVNNFGVLQRNYRDEPGTRESRNIDIDLLLSPANVIPTPIGYIGTTWQFCIPIPPEWVDSSVEPVFLLSASNHTGIGSYASESFFTN